MLAGALAAVALLPWLRGAPVRPLWLAVAGVVALLSLVRPVWLAPVNRALRTAGRAVGWVVQQVTLVVLFFFVLTPMAFVARRVRRDVMGRRFPGEGTTHWHDRASAEPLSESLKRPY